MNIGRKLKTLRVNKGYEPIEIAEILGISKNTYGRYERNETIPDMKMLEKIAQEYQIDLIELLSDDKLVFNQKNTKGDNNGLVINYLSEKLIELYEKQINEKDNKIEDLNLKLLEKDKEIVLLKEEIIKYKNIL